MVPTPTLPLTYIGVTPTPVFTSVHCDVGRFDNVEPSPLYEDAVITPLVESNVIVEPILT